MFNVIAARPLRRTFRLNNNNFYILKHKTLRTFISFAYCKATSYLFHHYYIHVIQDMFVLGHTFLQLKVNNAIDKQNYCSKETTNLFKKKLEKNKKDLNIYLYYHIHSTFAPRALVIYCKLVVINCELQIAISRILRIGIGHKL